MKFDRVKVIKQEIEIRELDKQDLLAIENYEKDTFLNHMWEVIENRNKVLSETQNKILELEKTPVSSSRDKNIEFNKDYVEMLLVLLVADKISYNAEKELTGMSSKYEVSQDDKIIKLS